jgi:MoaA/NifB/PqqE/SkfB family radical SAM enzyme
LAVTGSCFEAFDATRDFSDKALRALCYAPYTSLYFDNRGNVRACCHNFEHPLGNILESSIDEIWHGVRSSSLRKTLAAYEFGAGCDFCAFRMEGGGLENLSMRMFDKFTVAAAQPAWPQQMEFSISNVCNLECIMCRGLWSSAIRKRREKLPALPRLYSRDFIESLRKYLPHLQRAKFLGGEPFLIREYFWLWSMMIEDGLAVPCHVTTNGTQLNARVETVIDKISMGFSISLDGVSRETVEAIRVNADFEVQMRNVARFRDYTRERGTSFSLTFCLMRQNWHEFGEYCLMADEWDCAVGVNTVLQPPEFGLFTLPAEELRQVVAAMERQAVSLGGQLRRNKTVWFGELERLRHHCAAGAEDCTMALTL